MEHPSNSVAPREGRVSRNGDIIDGTGGDQVAPREGRVSRNSFRQYPKRTPLVAPREGRVSRNGKGGTTKKDTGSRAPRGACE